MSVAGTEVAAVIESMAVGYVTLRRDWRITYVNPAAEPVLGRPAADLVGQDLWEMFPGARELEFGQVYEQVMDTRRPASFDAFYPGLGVWFELRVQPADDGIAVYFLDVTAQKQAVAEAEAGRRRLELLAQVSEALGGSGDPDRAVARLARLVVPELADWSIVTVIDEDGRYRDVDWAHRDPDRLADVAAYARTQSATMTAGSPVATALRTGEPVVVPDLSDDALTAALADERAIEVARRLQPCGVAILPLRARGRTIGMIALVTERPRGPHTAFELETAFEVAARAAPVLDSARTAARAAGLAESMQRTMLDVFAPAPGLRLATRYRPAYDDRRVGGDWYDTFPLRDGSTVLTIGDVMGHDVAAMAAMAQLRTMMRTTAWTHGGSPAEVLTATNDASLHVGPAIFATAITADLSPPAPDGSVQLRWSNAGHPPPLLVDPDGHVSLLRQPLSDIPLGVGVGVSRRDHTRRLATGSTLLLYTDGLVERRDHDIDNGLARLVDLVRGSDAADLDGLLDAVLSDVTGTPLHHDDVALIAVRVEHPRTTTPGASGDASVTAGDASVAAGDASVTGGDVTVALPSDTTAPSAARRLVEQHAGDALGGLTDDALLLVSELVGNAVRHGIAPFTLSVGAVPSGVRIGVSDRQDDLPIVASGMPDTSKPSGRGLTIIAAFASSWGVTATHDAPGKTVWFELHTPAG